MSLYQSATIGTATNQITFNDTAQQPYFRVQSRAPQRRQLRDLDIPVPFENGIMDFETLTGQYTYVIQGTMYPASESDSDRGVSLLRKLASLEISQDDPLSDDGYVPYVWQEADRSKQLFLKVLYVNVSDNVKQGLIKQFTLLCKIKDPTIYSSEIITASTGQADPSATGSAVHSFTYPIVYGATLLDVSQDALNVGDIPVYPVGMRVYGPVTNPKIINNATGEYIEFSGTTLSTSSNILDIAYDKDSIAVTLDGVNYLSKITNASTYFKLQPGSNILQLTGSSVGSGAYLTCSYYSGWPLS